MYLGLSWYEPEEHIKLGNLDSIGLLLEMQEIEMIEPYLKVLQTTKFTSWTLESGYIALNRTIHRA